MPDPKKIDFSDEAVDAAFTKRWCGMAHLPSERVSEAQRWFRAGAAHVLAMLHEFGVQCRKATPIHRTIPRDGDTFATYHIETAAEAVARVLRGEATNG